MSVVPLYVDELTVYRAIFPIGPGVDVNCDGLTSRMRNGAKIMRRIPVMTYRPDSSVQAVDRLPNIYLLGQLTAPSSRRTAFTLVRR